MRTLFLILVLFLIDWYIFNGIKFLSRNIQPLHAKIIYSIFWGLSITSFAIIIAAYFTDWHQWNKPLRTYLFAFVFVSYFSKLFLILFLIIDDLFRIVRWGWDKLFESTLNSSNAINDSIKNSITRSDFILKFGLIVAAIPFVALIFGMVRGKYEYKVRNVKLHLDSLPEAFKGFRIVHISDLHTGSFMDSEPIAKAVGIINDLKPDLIVFTGDLVNDLHSELLPHRDVLSTLTAPHGVMSILVFYF